MFSQRDLDLTEEPMGMDELEDVLRLQRGMIDTMLELMGCPHPAYACKIIDNESVYCERCEEQLDEDQIIRRLPGDNRIR